MEGDPWRYRVQVGWTSGPSANWQSVTNWKDVGWDTYYERTNPGPFLDALARTSRRTRTM